MLQPSPSEPCSLSWIVGRVVVALVLVASAGAPARATYDDIVDYFQNLYADPDAAAFPVQNQSLSSIESAFGPRLQTSLQTDDWHRGIDIDGNLNSDPVVAALDGYFYDYRTTTAGGHIVILEHQFDDFMNGLTTSIEYNGKNMSRFYTWYMHLYDDQAPGNNTSTDDIVTFWKQQLDDFDIKTPISRGTTIGILGNSGEPAPNVAYGPHMHFELRVGTNSSLEFQLNNNVTQWGFDPHVNPVLLFEPYAYGSEGALGYDQVLAFSGYGPDGAVMEYTSTNDDMPLLNRWEVTVTDGLDQVVGSHVLDYNQRTGYNATATTLLDNWATNVPYVDPLAFGDQATQFQTQLIIPTAWLEGFGEGHTVAITATDIWGNSELVEFVTVPEPATWWVVFAPLAGILLAARQRRRRN
jgi:murein DD-endopeptidase MepM/ murein hydrolase activator NlpD